jgi:DNA-binding MarR family transcriptional regulator
MNGDGSGRLVLMDGLVQSSFLVQEVMKRVAREYGLSLVQARLLGILRDREPGILSLAEYLGLDKSSVTGLVDRAEARGLVERVTRPEDRRAISVVLSAEGRSLASGFAAKVDAELSTLTASMSRAGRDQLALRLDELLRGAGGGER